MFIEENKIWLEDGDRCEHCENLKDCFIFKCLDDQVIEILDGMDTAECSFFMMCDEGFNANYIAQLLNKRIKPRRSNLIQRIILWLRKKMTI